MNLKFMTIVYLAILRLLLSMLVLSHNFEHNLDNNTSRTIDSQVLVDL